MKAARCHAYPRIKKLSCMHVHLCERRMKWEYSKIYKQAIKLYWPKTFTSLLATSEISSLLLFTTHCKWINEKSTSVIERKKGEGSYGSHIYKIGSGVKGSVEKQRSWMINIVEKWKIFFYEYYYVFSITIHIIYSFSHFLSIYFFLLAFFNEKLL